jgi:hypothetical protein
MHNPLKNFLTDKTFHFLLKNNLLREKGLRDYHIRCRFKELKESNPTHLVIEILQNEYPYLQYETIRKIVYQKPDSKEIDITSYVVS